MARILLWRLIYHLLCFLKMIGYRGPKIQYFAYGVNLDPQVMKNRNIDIHSSRKFVIENYKLIFNHEIPFKDVAAGSIEPAQGEKVYGLLYTISKTDELRLDCMEAHIIFNRYGKEYLKDENETSFFFYRSTRSKDGLYPLKEYLGKILNGYQHIEGVPTEFLDSLSRTKTIEKFLPKNPPEFLIQNYEVLGSFFKNFLIWYDQKCVQVFAKLIFKPSFFEKLFWNSKSN